MVQNPIAVHSVPVSVDVSVSDVMRGVMEIDGILTLEKDSLLLEYRMSGLPGFVSSSIESFRVTFDDIQDVEYRERVFGAAIILRPRRLAVIEAMPGDQSTEIKLKIKRKHRSIAAELATDIQIAFARSRTDSLGSIPFSIPSASQHFSEVTGLIYLDDEFLVFELQSGLPGLSRNSDDIIKIEPKALAHIHLNTALLKDVLYIRPKKEQLLTVIPGDRVEAVRLKINNTYRSEVKRLVEAVRRKMAEPELDENDTSLANEEGPT